MYSSYLRPETTSQRFSTWMGSTHVVRALALSVLIGATITSMFILGDMLPEPVSSAKAAPTPPAAQVVVAKPAEPWAADESAKGTPPDRAH